MCVYACVRACVHILCTVVLSCVVYIHIHVCLCTYLLYYMSVQVMDVVSEEDWKNGTCFTGAVTTTVKSKTHTSKECTYVYLYISFYFSTAPATLQSVPLKRPFSVPSVSGKSQRPTAVSTPTHVHCIYMYVLASIMNQ